MKKILTIVLSTFMLVMLFCFTAKCQDNVAVGAGINYDQSANRHFNGTFFYAHTINEYDSVNNPTPLWNFNVVDVHVVDFKPFNYTVNITPGVGKQLVLIGKVPIYGTVGIGAAIGGENNLGYAFSSAMLAPISIGKGGLKIMPNFRVVKSSITPNAYTAGILIGWGGK